MTPPITYLHRRNLRVFERGWARLESFINRLAATAEPLRPYNPLYHLGPLVIFLLILLAATGVVLLLLYRPGMERAYESVQAVSRNWLGSIIRSMHRYASAALIVVAFLHALKMLLSDRFWGSRALAWVSGWLLVILFWLTGTMGYFLVWDSAAQWLTEYAMNTFGGAFALSFLGPQAAGRTYSFFVIVLFLHAFLPLILAIGILVHVLRLQRPRYWAPRWLMVVATTVLIILSVLWPATSNLPADLRRLAPVAQIDWWYLGFLPLITRLGNPAFWGLSLAALSLIIALPWLWRGRHHGPSAVDAARCTGCTTCARECPYNAIEMVPRRDDSPHAQVALVKGHLCTGCGICVAACPENAIDLTHLTLGGLHRQVQEALAQAKQGGEQPLLVYACDRHVALGSFDLTPRPPLLPGEGERLYRGGWPGAGRPAIICALPCMGALRADAVAEALTAGAAEVLLVACPAHDCSHREGPRWLTERRHHRGLLEQPRVRLATAAPGSRGEALAAAGHGLTAHAPAPDNRRSAAGGTLETPGAGRAARIRAATRSLVVGLALLAVLFGASVLANRPASALTPQPAQIRIAINHHGQLLARSRDLPPDILAKLPPGVDPALVLGGERFPVRLRLHVDGQLVLERTYRPGGLRREGSIYGLETFWLAPGAHRVEISLMDDGAHWRTVFADGMTVGAGEAATLVYEPNGDVFVRWR